MPTSPSSDSPASHAPTHTDPVPEEGLEFWVALAVMMALFIGALLWVELTAFGT